MREPVPRPAGEDLQAGVGQQRRQVLAGHAEGVPADPQRPSRVQLPRPHRDRLRQQLRRGARPASARRRSVHHAVGGVGDDGVETFLPVQRPRRAGVPGEHRRHQLPSVDGDACVEATTDARPVAAHRGDGGRVFDAFAAQPGFVERRHRVEGLVVGLHSEGVAARDECRRDGGAAPGHRVQHPVGGVAPGRRDGDVQQQPGELFVGLSLVFGDGHEVVVEDIGVRQRDGSQ